MPEETQIQELLALRWPPVAVSFQASAPPGIPRAAAGAPSGCSYWKLAAEGHAFYTEALDHYGCPVGAFTHGIDLPAEKTAELEGLVELMVGLEYLQIEEIPIIPRRTEPFGVAVYAPLPEAQGVPDVVLVRGNARQIMLLAEAAHAAGAAAAGAALGRPSCAVIPAAMRGGQGTASLGCIGNRIYTELADGELYFAIPGPQLDRVTEKLAVIVRANRELESFHKARL